MEIAVTREHIKAGNNWNREFHPIALAVREMQGVIDAELNGDYLIVVRLDDDGIARPQTYQLTSEAYRFIGWFNHDEPVKPFSFTATLITDTDRLWRISEYELDAQ